MTPPKVENPEKLDYSVLMGIKNYTVLLENKLLVSYKIKHTTTTQPRNHTLWHYLREIEINVHSKFAYRFSLQYNGQKKLEMPDALR